MLLSNFVTLKKDKRYILGIVIVISLITISIIVSSYINNLNQILRESKAALPESSTVSRLVFSDFYWWYPWFGVNAFHSTINDSGFVRQDVFPYTFTAPIPYLQSSERPNGIPNDQNGVNLAKNWIKGNFQRAASAGIQVLTPMARPDLGDKFQVALNLMIQSEKDLKSQNMLYPKLMLHYDGVEYWNSTSKHTGQLTGPGTVFDAIWNGTKTSYDTIFSAIGSDPITDYLYTYPDNNSFPIVVYRIEGDAHDMTTNDWWVSELKNRFSTTYPGKHLYVILEDYWCNKTYGVNNTVVTKSCNADNYYSWGGPAIGYASKSSKAVSPIIYTVGPGWDVTKINPKTTPQPRDNGTYYTKLFNQAIDANADWIFIEDFNFGEEGAAVDDTLEWGNKYLDLTQKLINAFIPPSGSSSNISSITSSNSAINISCTRYDFNNDSKLDILDFAKWRICYQKSLTNNTNCAFAELNTDNKVDISDFAIFIVALNNYRTTIGNTCVN